MMSGAFDAENNYEPTTGGTATYWSPETEHKLMARGGGTTELRQQLVGDHVEDIAS